MARERPAGAAKGAAQPGVCADCGAAVGDKYCGSCGQVAGTERNLAQLAEKGLHSILHFDSKIWRTLPLLVLNPGKLTHDYVYGQRTRYLGPGTLFLMTAFLMFMAFDLAGGAIAPIPVAASVDVAATTGGANAGNGLARAMAAINSLGIFGASVTARDIPGAPGHPILNAGLAKAFANPQVALIKVQQKAYKLNLLLVPLSLPILWLLFVRRRDVRLFDHAVFALYSISFMSLLMVLVAVIAAVGVRWLPVYAALLLAVPPLHMFVQLRGSYALSVTGALWRTAVLAAAAVTTLAAYAIIVLAAALAG